MRRFDLHFISALLQGLTHFTYFIGNYVKNAFIVDSFLQNVSISAADIKFSSGQGIAYFNDQNNLISNSKIQIDSDGGITLKNLPDYR